MIHQGVLDSTRHWHILGYAKHTHTFTMIHQGTLNTYIHYDTSGCARLNQALAYVRVRYTHIHYDTSGYAEDTYSL
jgi:hypothetical protein